MDFVSNIIEYIIESFIHAWPYLLLTIPISVAVKMSGMSKYITRSLNMRPILAILLSTFVGAFSPLCSCTVIPLIASLLIGGVPLAPVMSFWLASPSMDPEIFFLTVSSLGWDLAVWRLSATLVMSLGGGLITLMITNRGWLGAKMIRETQSTEILTFGKSIQNIFNKVTHVDREASTPLQKQNRIAVTGNANPSIEEYLDETDCGSGSCCAQSEGEEENSSNRIEGKKFALKDPRFWEQLFAETRNATMMVIKFMLLAWFLGAVIRLYIPEYWITNALGNDSPLSIIMAALLGIPAYTSSLAALPLVSGLLDQGMHPAVALAFLIAGPTTTLPAMSAVWGLVNRRVFALYIGFSLFSAIFLGYLYSLFL